MNSRESFPKYSLVTIALILLFFLAFSKISYAQDDVIRVDTNLVAIPVTVLDREGRFVSNLQKKDFQILENEVEQELAVFEPSEKPFTVLLLLDVSGSMKDFLGNLARAANAFVSKLRPDDELIVVAFSDQVNTLIEATKIRDLNGNIKLKQKFREETTIIYDAVNQALKKMKKIRGRKAIVLFSDGVGVGIATAKGTLRDAEEQEALIYTVKFGTHSNNPPSYVSKKYYFKRIEEIESYMRDLAQKTGGRNFQIENIADLEQTFGEVADELGRQYSLGYYPKTEGKKGDRRQIKVKVRQPNLVVRARESYVVKESKN